MNYLKIYNQLADVQLSDNTAMPAWQRIKLTFSIAKCSSLIQEEICKYLETQEQPEYVLTLTFKDPKTQQIKNTVVSCSDVQSKLRLQPLPALLYMDWLRREPEQAAAFIVRKDDLSQMSRDKIRAHIDPELLAKVDKAKKEKEQRDMIKIECGD